jgi:hypothetical protein
MLDAGSWVEQSQFHLFAGYVTERPEQPEGREALPNEAFQLTAHKHIVAGSVLWQRGLQLSSPFGRRRLCQTGCGNGASSLQAPQMTTHRVSW